MTDSGYAVGISSEISPELIQEGVARELVHRIQNMRKEAGFDISDHINLSISGSREITEIAETHISYVTEETLSVGSISTTHSQETYDEEHEIDGEKIQISINRVV